MKDLKKRTAISVLAIALIVGLFFCAAHPYFRYLSAAIISCISAIATWEYIQLTLAKGARAESLACSLASACVTLSLFLSSQRISTTAPVLVIFLAMTFFCFFHLRQAKGAIFDLAASSFGIFYLAIPFGFILKMFYFPIPQEGLYWVAYFLAVTKSTDMAAYFVGNLWGKRKLVPKLSPGKTVEGLIGGVFAALLVSKGFQILGNGGVISLHLSHLEWIGFGFVFSLMGQFGDLVESLLKRDAKVKDSNVLPGLGGVLDSVDSLLFNAPILYIYLLIKSNLL